VRNSVTTKKSWSPSSNGVNASVTEVAISRLDNVSDASIFLMLSPLVSIERMLSCDFEGRVCACSYSQLALSVG
jgi:hypothetical protein